MGLRPGRCTRKIRRPWTRVSKRKVKKNFVGGIPGKKIHVFEMGNKKKDFNTTIYLVAKRPVQIRDNALEAARVSANKHLERKLTPENYFLKMLLFPHQILREHTLATGAGADRFSMGMRKSFGKPKGRAAIVRKDQRIIRLKLDKKNVEAGKLALHRADLKLPTPCKIVVE
ncbi:MAG: 50S ribosomal protein L16 [Candidatus Aenigmarchaeota archaeon]|nr:50S ribosomal protein L16 [Candidatus Aenigmarchaeota archaeon]